MPTPDGTEEESHRQAATMSCLVEHSCGPHRDRPG